MPKSSARCRELFLFLGNLGYMQSFVGTLQVEREAEDKKYWNLLSASKASLYCVVM